MSPGLNIVLMRWGEKMKTKIMICFVSICLISVSATADSSFVGEYCSISESEWEVCLSLFESGSGSLKLEQWAPGEYDNKEVRTVEVIWIEKEDSIEIKYGSVKEAFQLGEISLEILGQDGFHAGLRLMGLADQNSMIGNHILWKEPITIFK